MSFVDPHKMKSRVHMLQKGERQNIENTKHDSSRKGGEKDQTMGREKLRGGKCQTRRCLVPARLPVMDGLRWEGNTSFKMAISTIYRADRGEEGGEDSSTPIVTGGDGWGGFQPLRTEEGCDEAFSTKIVQLRVTFDFGVNGWSHWRLFCIKLKILHQIENISNRHRETLKVYPCHWCVEKCLSEEKVKKWQILGAIFFYVNLWCKVEYMLCLGL